MSKGLSVVGKRITQPDAPAKATGSAKYAADLKIPGMLVGRVLRSPYPHAKIVKIDKTKAENLPGVEAVAAFEDTPKIKFSSSFRDLPLRGGGVLSRADQFILADKARYVGDAIAAVASINEDIAEEALNLIEVTYEQLPAVLNPEDAMKNGAPQVHDDIKGNVAERVRYPQAVGDVEQAFQESEVVVESTFDTKKQVACQLEPQTVIADYDAAGRLTIWSPNQLTHPLRREIAHMFGMPVGKVRVINPYVGGSFGTRLSCSGEPICALLSMVAAKPVRLDYTKEEDFKVMETRTPIKYTLKMGFKKDGTLHAIQMNVRTFSGGYLARSDTIGVISMLWGMGNYRCPNRDGEAAIVYTNTTMSGAQRGYGNGVASWGVEQLMDVAAEKLSMDPVELRLKNIKKVGEIANMGLPIESTAQDKCLILGAEKIGWKEKKARKKGGIKRRGIGCSSIMHMSGGHPGVLEHSSAFIKFNEDGTASLIIHPGSPGTHIWGALSQIAAEELGIYPEDINIVSGDTDVTLFDLGSHASRSTHVTGLAVLQAAQDAKKEILKRAAKKLRVSPDELDVKDRKVYVKTSPEKSITIAQIVFDSIYNFEGECLSISGRSSAESKWCSPCTVACFAEVEVDTETGAVKVEKILMVIDSGIAVNPMSVEGQAEGAIGFGLGFALTEKYVINQDSGKTESDNFTTYKIQGTLDMPETEIILVEEPDPKGPFGAKGTAEPTLVSVAPAIANAVYDAVGVRITEAPITPEKILEALRKQ
jgi:xanthine dehydrogenase molybdenum-binding subunit